MKKISSLSKDRLSNFPASMVLESFDQHQRWFLTSLVTSVALTGSTHFESLKTQGLVVDQTGEPINYSTQSTFDAADFIEGTVKQNGER
jgi:isoleucyl-tRNA synthetase